MGIRVAAFTALFNLLFWTSRLTWAAALESRGGAGLALVSACVAPFALLAMARRLSPARASAFTATASASLLVAGLATAA